MLPLLHLILMVLALFIPLQTIAQYQPPYTSFFVPIHKHTDAFKPLYSAQIMTEYVNMQFVPSNFLIDIDAPLSWRDCIVQWNMYPGSCPDNALCTSPVSCDEYQCTEARTSYSYKSVYCPRVRNITAPDGYYCTCPVNVMDPIDGSSCNQPLLNYDTFFVNTTNGKNPDRFFYSVSSNAACAPSSSFQAFPTSVTGVIAFSSSPYAFTVALDQPPLNRTFSLCFPSTTTTPGILFYGSGPYNLLPHSSVDVKSFLSYTPLLNQPDSFGYFIGVNSIVIKTRSIEILGDTKLSTIDPYTTLRTDIYNPVIRRFSMVTKRLTPVNAIAPFGLCFNTSTNNGTKTNLKVPDIDFNLKGGKKWTISTSNSMKQVTQDVVCLAFVDGGATSEHAIVIGSYQFEDNFLSFDLENSNFGFSSSLLRKQTSCANFNFTMVE